MKKIECIGVFCGARDEVDPIYLEIGQQLGEALAHAKLKLVYGGADCGVMGAVANTSMKHSGYVTGVYPRVLEGLEAANKNISEVIIVDDMHTRKMKMFDRADAFIILPGGFGTMDETFEVITWKQLHTHEKPIILLNFNRYWDHWIALTDHFIEHGFAKPKTRQLYDVVNTIEDAFKVLGVDL